MATARAALTSAALALAADLPVFPCNSAKKPVIEGGFKSASRDPKLIGKMFARSDATLIGMPTGRASGRVVIDVDPRHGGDAGCRSSSSSKASPSPALSPIPW